MEAEQKESLIRIVTAALLTAGAHLFMDAGPMKPGESLVTRLWESLPYFAAYAVISWNILIKAWKNIRRGQVFDENFLMAVASLGAFFLGFFQNGEYTEAIAVMLFYQVGELFEDYAVDKSRRNISELMDIRPDYANVEENGKLIRIDPDDVAVGTLIVVQPGEKVPIDGTVVSGHSTLNTAALTGESLPLDVEPGMAVVSGSINQQGVLKICTSKEFCDSTVSKILELVEDAGSRKSKSENFISKFARYYTPIVCCSALALSLIPPFVRIFMGLEPLWSSWIYRSLTFLVISCPCALVLSVPLTFFAGIGGASHEGILIKGSNYMETLSQAATVVMDKTGTLTKGVFEVVGIHHSPVEDHILLEWAALAENASSHPISTSLQKAYGKPLDRSRVTEIKELSGRGIQATVDGRSILCGNAKLMEEAGISYLPCHQVGTLVHMAVDGTYAGHILIADVVKPHSIRAIDELKKQGIATVMLTGDAKQVAEKVAQELGISRVYSELLPEDKVTLLEKITQQKNGNEKVLFVGDGINDAPVLSLADVGIAMGAMGSDAAIEAADVVLMDDDPLKIGKAIRISKKCVSIVHQNIYFAIGIKVIVLILGALGLANMWMAIFADTGVLIMAVMNAMRALFVKKV